LRTSEPALYAIRKQFIKFKIEDLNYGVCRIVENPLNLKKVVSLRIIPQDLLQLIQAATSEAQLQATTEKIALHLVTFPRHNEFRFDRRVNPQPSAEKSKIEPKNWMMLEILIKDWMDHQSYIRKFCEENYILEMIADRKQKRWRVLSLTNTSAARLTAFAYQHSLHINLFLIMMRAIPYLRDQNAIPQTPEEETYFQQVKDNLHRIIDLKDDPLFRCQLNTHLGIVFFKHLDLRENAQGAIHPFFDKFLAKG